MDVINEEEKEEEEAGEDGYEKVAEVVSQAIMSYHTTTRDPPFITMYEHVIGHVIRETRKALTFSYVFNGNRVKVSVDDVRITPPSGLTHPAKCELSGLTYSTDLHVTMTMDYNGETVKLTHVPCSIPVMTRSKHCILSSPDANRDQPELQLKQIQKGVFIIDGAMCCALPSFKPRNGPNRIQIRERKVSSTSHTGRPIHHYTATHIAPLLNGVTIINMVVNTDPRIVGTPEEVQLCLRVPSSSSVIPLGLVFRALGYTRDSFINACNMLKGVQGLKVWNSESLVWLNDGEISQPDACDRIEEIGKRFMPMNGRTSARAGIDYVMSLIYPSITHKSNPASPLSESYQKQTALLFMFQYMVIAVEREPEIVDNLIGPILYSFDPFTSAIMRVIYKYRSTLERPHGKSTPLSAFKQFPETAAASASINSSMSVPSQPKKTTIVNTGRRNTATCGFRVETGATVCQVASTPYAITMGSAPTHPGSICSFSGPKSEAATTRRRFAIGAYMAEPCDMREVYQYLGLWTDPKSTTAVIVDGICVGYSSMSPEDVMRTLRNLQSDMGSDISDITFLNVHNTSTVHIFACPNRICYYVFDLSRVRRTDPADMLDMMNGRSSKDAILNMLSCGLLMPFCDGCSTHAHIAVGLSDSVIQDTRFTHAYPSNEVMMSLIALVSNPMLSMQRPVRSVQSAAMYTQAHQMEPCQDFSGGNLIYAQKHLDNTVDSFPTTNCLNAIVAFVADTDLNEDAVIFNQTSFDRGALNIHRTVRIKHTRRNQSNDIFAQALESYRDFPEYQHLDENGMAKINTVMRHDMILIFDFRIVHDQGGAMKFEDCSIRHKARYAARVNGHHCPSACDVSLTMIFVPPLHGMKTTIGPVKGIVGLVRAAVDMPTDQDGIPVDMLVTYGSASRGTAGPLTEGVTLMHRVMNPDDEVFDAYTPLHKRQALAAHCADEIKKHAEDRCRVICSGKEGCKGKCKPRYMMGSNGRYIGRFEKQPDGSRRFKYADIGVCIVPVTILHHLPSVKAKVVNHGNMQYLKDGTPTSGIGRGYMEMFANQGNECQTMKDADGHTARLCNVCGEFCNKDSSLRFKCPNGHASEFNANYSYPASMDRLAVKLAAAAGIGFLPTPRGVTSLSGVCNTDD